MRYVNKQHDKFSCGPIAVINALKSLNKKATLRTHRKKFFKLGLKRDGMHIDRLSESLKFFKVNFKRVKNPTVRDIERVLNAGNKVILCYRWFTETENAGHYIFIRGHSKKYFCALNDTHATRKQVMAHFFTRSKRINKGPVMWIIKQGRI